MLFKDSYYIPTKACEGLYKEKGSKFIAYAFPVFSEEDIKERLQEIRKKEYSARHHCYAYTLYPDKSAWRANDDGEPANTAGKPILGQIQSKDLTNILIIVVRYFGGVKLGVSGLITAYRTAAADALKQITIEKYFVKEIYEVAFQYPQMNEVMRLVKDKSLEVINQDFQINCKITFAIRKSQADVVVAAFKNNHELTINYQKTI
tara:strand:+ start:138 stop:752 length:615 start_codon:yes stop_codon:yes gene_type:complete